MSEEVDILLKHMSHSKHTVGAYYQKPLQTAALKALLGFMLHEFMQGRLISSHA